MTATRTEVIELRDPRDAARRIPVWIHRPANFAPDGRVVIVLHGMSRDARAYCEAWAPEAERHGFLVVAPEFPATDYPTARDYNFGNVLAPDGSLMPRPQWLFPVIENIVDRARQVAGGRATYCLYGHSAGGQVVHRLAALWWSERIELAITANSGSYSVPSLDVCYPFGLGGTGLEEKDLLALLARPLVVLLGARDNDPQHPSLPRNAEAARQGPHRLARGRHYFALARQLARHSGVALGWRIALADDVGHAHAEMAPHAARLYAGAQPDQVRSR